MTEGKRKYRRLTFTERRQIAELLDSEAWDTESKCYKEGWSDAVVAARLMLTKDAVAGFRLREYGAIRVQSSAQSQLDNLISVVGDLTKRLEFLEKELGVRHEQGVHSVTEDSVPERSPSVRQGHGGQIRQEELQREGLEAGPALVRHAEYDAGRDTHRVPRNRRG